VVVENYFRETQISRVITTLISEIVHISANGPVVVNDLLMEVVLRGITSITVNKLINYKQLIINLFFTSQTSQITYRRKALQMQLGGM
jgi:hypothetical protein